MRVKGEPRSPGHRPQRGFALIALLAILATGMLYFLVGQLDAGAAQRRHDDVTTQALAQAKEALIAYATSTDLSSGSKRPGDLPCPDRDDDGSADTPCNNQPQRLGRLPWQSLGLSELRDGSGEHLWYAVSNNFKNSTRTAILNSDTLGTITIRDGAGTIMYNGSSTTGVVAVIIAPGPPIARQDGLQQDRSGANASVAKHYLDNIAGEDNADFGEVGTTTDGFFAGPVRDVTHAAQLVANDRIVAITREELMAAIGKRVAGEVTQALLIYYCGSSTAIGPNQTCLGAGGSRTFPGPASFVDATCLGGHPINSPDCGSAASNNEGRIAANPAVPWTTYDVLSPLRGTIGASGNWFQKNGWRELTYVAISNKCVEPATNCGGSGGFLTVDSTSNAKVVVIVAGTAFSAAPVPQIRSAIPDKLSVWSYLEAENATTSDGSFVSRSATPPFNDIVGTIR